jgi:polysaccharide export outer membrane protein
MKKILIFIIATSLIAVFAQGSLAQQRRDDVMDRAAKAWIDSEDQKVWYGQRTSREEEVRWPRPQVLSIATYPDYPIQPHTTLHITLRGDEPHLEQPGIQAKVSTNGTIRYPYIGEIKVAGLTAEEVAEKIEKLLKKDYVRAPEVSVRVIAAPGYWVLGAVTNTGRYDLVMDREITLKEAIDLAGGFDYPREEVTMFRDDWTSIQVTRTKGDERLLYDFKLDEIPENFTVKPDDIILCRYGEMKDRGNFYVFGEVQNPGKYPLVPDSYSGVKLFRYTSVQDKYITILGASNVIDAISIAGGMTSYAARNWVRLVRFDENGKRKSYVIPMGRIIYKGDVTKNMQLKDGDIVTVPESWF